MRNTSITATTKALARKFSHAILPVQCASCAKPLWGDLIPFFCDECWSRIYPISGPTCPRCHLPFPSRIALQYSSKHRCARCRLHPPAFTQAWTLYPYQSPLKEAIGLFKYRRKTALAKPMARLMTAALPSIPPIDFIIPVPLHPTRLREREYNQSLFLAHCLSQYFQIPFMHANLIRIRQTTPQTSLSRNERLKNLRRAFTLTAADMIEGKATLLVDDVFTTGTTANECAKTLRKAGAGNVYVVTLARML